MANMTVPYQLADGRMALDIDTSKTLAAGDSGIVQNLIADALVITLLASASTNVGFEAIVRLGGARVSGLPKGAVSDSSQGAVITPASGDGVTGGAWTAAINKGVTFTKGSGQTGSKTGDEVRMTAGGANTAAAWMVNYMKGTSVGRTA